MKFSDFKVGQLVGVSFPYSKNPEKKYGFRILEIYDVGRIVVLDIKTNEKRGFNWKDWNAPGFYAKYSDRPIYQQDLPHWKLVESAP